VRSDSRAQEHGASDDGVSENLLSLTNCEAECRTCGNGERTIQAELQSIANNAQDRAAYLRLTETLSAFPSCHRSSAKTIDITERQQIIRLLTNEVVVGEDAIIIYHLVRVTSPPRDNEPPKSSKSGGPQRKSYPLRSWRHFHLLV
jgi:site-specific DNA recombinase